MDSLGLVAIAPFFSQSDNLNCDSNYSFLRSVVPEMASICQNTLFLVLFPDPDYGNDRWRYTPDGFQSEHIRFVKWPYDTATLSSVANFPIMRFREIDMDMGVSIWWLNLLEMAPMAVHGYQKVYVNVSQPALVGHAHYVIHRSLPYNWETQFTRLWLQAGGTLACNCTVFNTSYALRMAEESYGEYLNESALSIMRNNARILPIGSVHEDDPIAPPADSSTPPVILYNHRFEAYKQPLLTFEILSELRPDFPDLQIWATQSIGMQTQHFPIDHVPFAPDRYSYIRNIAVPAINTINSLHETQCIAIVDSMTVGHLVVVPNALTFPEIVPPSYPYLFNNPQEQRAMLRDILESWPDAYNRWRTVLAEHARTHFGVKEYARSYLAILEEAELQKREVERKANTKKVLDDTWRSMRKNVPYPIMSIGREARRRGGFSIQAMGNRRVLREAMCEGGIEISWQNGVVLTRTAGV